MLYWKYICFKFEQFTGFVLSIFAGIIKPLNANTNFVQERYIIFVFIAFSHTKTPIQKVQIGASNKLK